MSWLKATFIRVVRGTAEITLASIGAAAVFSEVAWDEVLGAAALGAIIVFLTCLAGLPETDEAGPLEGKLGHLGNDGGQVNLTIILVFVLGFLLGALCYANGIIVGS